MSLLKVQFVKFGFIYDFYIGKNLHSAHKYMNVSVYLLYSKSNLDLKGIRARFLLLISCYNVLPFFLRNTGI